MSSWESETFHEVNPKCEGYNHTNSIISQEVRLQYGLKWSGQELRTWEKKWRNLRKESFFDREQAQQLEGFLSGLAGSANTNIIVSTIKHLHVNTYISYIRTDTVYVYDDVKYHPVYVSRSLNPWIRQKAWVFHPEKRNQAIPVCKILQFSATLPQIPKPKATSTTITARNCGPVATNSTHEHLNCCLGGRKSPFVVVCHLFIRAHIQTWHRHQKLNLLFQKWWKVETCF